MIIYVEILNCLQELIYFRINIFQWDDYLIFINSKWPTNEQISLFFIKAIFTKDPKHIFCTHISYGHIQLLRLGCPDIRSRSDEGQKKVFHNSNVIIRVNIVIVLVDSTNTITMFVFRKVTGNVYGCKTLFCTLYNLHKFKNGCQYAKNSSELAFYI